MVHSKSEALPGHELTIKSGVAGRTLDATLTSCSGASPPRIPKSSIIESLSKRSPTLAETNGTAGPGVKGHEARTLIDNPIIAEICKLKFVDQLCK